MTQPLKNAVAALPDMPIVALRKAVFTAISEYDAVKNFPGGCIITTPGDWPTAPTSQISGQGPAEVKIKSYRASSQSLVKANPLFSTTLHIRVDVRLSSLNADGKFPSESDAQLRIESLMYLLKQAVIPNYTVNSLVEQIVSVEDNYDTTAEGAGHTAQGVMLFGFMVTEGMESYDTTYAAQPFKGINIYADLTNVADLEGTYAPPFGYPVAPAPRTQGPDGRAEGAITIDLNNP